MKRPASCALVVSLFAGLSLVTEARSQTLIVSGKTGKCLDVPDASKTTHAIIQQSQCDGGLSQRWFFRNGTIVNQNSGLCLDIPGGYESDHTPLQQYPCHGGPNQLWTIGTNGEIKSVATRKCLDIPDGLSDDHLFVQQFQCSGGPDQAWSIRSATFNTAAPSPSSSGSTVEFGTDRYGNDYRIFNVPPDNYGACRTACEADDHCQAWSYESSNPQRSNGVCWLKNPAPAAVPKPITTSGVILARTAQSQPAPGTDALARGDEAFQAQEYMESFRWYVVAAGQGSAQAEQNLGFLYYRLRSGIRRRRTKGSRSGKAASDGCTRKVLAFREITPKLSDGTARPPSKAT
jgi:Ricin-type beta-trefoil lectin domain/PAN domain